MDALEKLLYLSGISADFLGYDGQRQAVSREDRLRALRAMGYDAGDPEAVDRAIAELDAEPWRDVLRPCYIVEAEAAHVALQLPPGQGQRDFDWVLQLEGGARRSGRCRPGQLPEVGEYRIGDRRYAAHRLALGQLPPGYHQLCLHDGEGDIRAQVIACPSRAHDMPGEDRFWGATCQLYTLRSARNWGVGDFTDLTELVNQLAGLGADLVGLNPLHAPCSDSPDAASPYSPSDRRFLNPVYLDPECMPDWQECGGAALLTAARVARRRALHDAARVDYHGVNTLKYELYEALFAHFLECHLDGGSARADEFRAFVDTRGAALEHFVAHEMAHNPYARRFRDCPRFFGYLQWQAQAQLARCHQQALDAGMRIGLMRDLAVGAVRPGSEVAQFRGLFLPGVTVGAPPDPLGPLGQDWGFPAMSPLAMRRQRFGHFIELLRSNMAAAGALRIDHAMALERLWWCLPESAQGPRSGLYVYYPREELLALLRLESQRSGCLVIGEDLGVVPEGFRRRMRESHIYGNRLLYFDTHLDGRQRLPWEQVPDTLLMVTNHDVPTLADWWSGSDLRRRFELGLIACPEVLEAARARRREEKTRLLDWLVHSGVWAEPSESLDPDRVFDMALCRAIHQACARGRSRLLLLQLEDLQLLREPVNIPGTWREYPNWRRKQGADTRSLLADPQVRDLLAAVDRERKS
ncbi:4-alpha-glucanotransferase [Parahaliea mediterranea]|uniref:4-alpha-glucanotransferase n=1 Tax=Parahaliea mediterranea TaxID=651086 RepID=A0A939DHQ7_9GAMM|nr:4-alpha-glucanotransferase [Parahaliea mediterranea]MBN7798545.1 4-alpha-glucanotransferase [Parahaliea mediterranea]